MLAVTSRALIRNAVRRTIDCSSRLIDALFAELRRVAPQQERHLLASAVARLRAVVMRACALTLARVELCPRGVGALVTVTRVHLEAVDVGVDERQ